MIRGHLIAYDETGRSWVLEGEAEGDIIPHEIPVGQLKVVELPYGALENAKSFTYSEQQGLVVVENNEYNDLTEASMALLEAEGVI